jgi:hypothetical protein
MRVDISPRLFPRERQLVRGNPDDVAIFFVHLEKVIDESAA